MGLYDANFHDGQLRISAYLRTVGKGLPPRPKRNNRRRKIVEENGQTSRERANTNNDDPFSPSTSKTVDVHPLFIETGDEKTKEIQRLTPSPKNSPSPRQKTPITRQKEIAVKALSGNQGSSHTRKRRLPVNQLALLRTTCSQGLPDPSDIEIAPATQVTESDPIEDSENIAFAALRTSPITPISRKLAPHQEYKPNPTSFSKKVTCRLQTLPKQDRSKKIRLNFDSVSDGFTGTELRIKPGNRIHVPRKKAKVEPQRKNKLVKRELALAFGTLPGPTRGQDEDLEIPLPIDRSHIQLEVAHTISGTSQPVQPAMAGSRKSVKADEYSRHRSPQKEELIRNQLACVTAPLRRDSESPTPEFSGEEHSSEDEDESNAWQADSRSRSMEPANLPDEFDENPYFEEAMYNLNVADTTSSSGNLVWSQYGTTR